MIEIKQKVGTVFTDEATLKRQIKSAKKSEINAKTQEKIFKCLGVNSKDKAMIAQFNLQGEATSIIASKTIGGKYPKGGEARLLEIGKIKETIFNAIKAGREAKAKI